MEKSDVQWRWKIVNGYRFIIAPTVSIYGHAHKQFRILVRVYWSETMINFGSTSGSNWAGLFKRTLFTLGIGEGTKKGALKMLF